MLSCLFSISKNWKFQFFYCANWLKIFKNCAILFLRDHGGIGRHAGFRFQSERVEVQILLVAPQVKEKITELCDFFLFLNKPNINHSRRQICIIKKCAAFWLNVYKWNNSVSFGLEHIIHSLSLADNVCIFHLCLFKV